MLLSKLALLGPAYLIVYGYFTMILLVDSFRLSRSFRWHRSFLRQDSRLPINFVTYSSTPASENSYQGDFQKRDYARKPNNNVNNQHDNKSRRVYMPKVSSSYSTPDNTSYTRSGQSYFHYASSNSEGEIRTSSFSDKIKPRFTFPIGEARNNRLPTDQADMELTFLGTASCIPTVTRGVNSIALRYGSNTHLFDCGEGTQIQVQKSRIKLSTINKIFISHLHGDHSFGLPGFLCFLGSSLAQENSNDFSSSLSNGIAPIDIYGPEGIRHFIRSVLQLTQSRISAPHRIHELKNIPFLHSKHQRYSPIPEGKIITRPDSLYGERPGGLDLYPDDEGIYHIPPTEEETRYPSKQYKPLVYKAAPMQHSIPCVGYVAIEPSRPGELRFDEVKDLIESQKEEIAQSFPELKGDWRKIYALLKALKPSESITLPNGVRIKGEDVNEPPKDGRRIVIMGDTCNGNYIKPIAMNATVLVHEATNAFIPEFDRPKYNNYYELEKDSYVHGHSTPQMAGRFAKSINAQQLVLTHFSSRYNGDSKHDAMMTMWRIEDMARSAHPQLKRPNDVIAAWDSMSLPIYASRCGTSIGNGEVEESEKDASEIKGVKDSKMESVESAEVSKESESVAVPLTENEEILKTNESVSEVISEIVAPTPAKRGRKKKVVVAEA